MIPVDKQAHFYSGAALCFAIGLFFDPLWGFLAAMAAGIAKEAWDMSGHGTPDALDMMATIIGGIVAFIVFYLAGFVNLLEF